MEQPPTTLEPDWKWLLGNVAFGAPLAIYFIKQQYDLVNRVLPLALATIQGELKKQRQETRRVWQAMADVSQHCKRGRPIPPPPRKKKPATVPARTPTHRKGRGRR